MEDVYDIIVVDAGKFERSKSRQTAQEVSRLNTKAAECQTAVYTYRRWAVGQPGFVAWNSRKHGIKYQRGGYCGIRFSRI